MSCLTPFVAFNNVHFHKKNTPLGDEYDVNFSLLLFCLGSIAASTNNFSITNKLGQGGFGPVYKVISHLYSYAYNQQLIENSII